MYQLRENTRAQIPLATQAIEALIDAILRTEFKGKKNKGKACVIICRVI